MIKCLFFFLSAYLILFLFFYRMVEENFVTQQFMLILERGQLFFVVARGFWDTKGNYLKCLRKFIWLQLDSSSTHSEENTQARKMIFCLKYEFCGVINDASSCFLCNLSSRLTSVIWRALCFGHQCNINCFAPDTILLNSSLPY